MTKRKQPSVTIADVQAAAGLRSRQAVMGWVEMGLLPPATMERGPGGRGRRGVWPVSVLKRIRFIRFRTGQGLTLAAVLMEIWKQNQPQAAEVKRRVNAIMGRWVTRGGSRHRSLVYRKGKQRSRALPHNAASIQDVWRLEIARILAEDIGLSSGTADRLARQAGDRPILERALSLLLSGFMPVLVIARGHISVVTSASVGFQHQGPVATGLITIQVYMLLWSCLFLSDDEESGPRRVFVTALAVDELDLDLTYFVRHNTDVFLEKDGRTVGFTLSGGEIVAGPAHNKLVALASSLSESIKQELVKRSTKPSSPLQKAPRKRKAARRRA